MILREEVVVFAQFDLGLSKDEAVRRTEQFLPSMSVEEAKRCIRSQFAEFDGDVRMVNLLQRLEDVE